MQANSLTVNGSTATCYNLKDLKIPNQQCAGTYTKEERAENAEGISVIPMNTLRDAILTNGKKWRQSGTVRHGY